MSKQFTMLMPDEAAALTGANEALRSRVAELEAEVARVMSADPVSAAVVRDLREEVDDWKSKCEGRDKEIKRLTDENEEQGREVEKLESRVVELEDEIEEMKGGGDYDADGIAAKVYYEMTGQHITWLADHVERERWISAVRQALPS